MNSSITHFHFQTITSTNDWAKQNLKLFNPEHLIIISADRQTAGRGRYRRTWHSPAQDNIYATFVLFSKKEIDASAIVQWLAKVVQEVLLQEGVKTTIKWPNDLLCEGKKIAGILLEITPYQDKYCLIMGLGLNVNMKEADLKKIDQEATSLAVKTQKTWDAKELLQKIIKKLLSKSL